MKRKLLSLPARKLSLFVLVILLAIDSLTIRDALSSDDLIDFERVLSLKEKAARLTYSQFILSLELDEKLYVNLEEFIVALGFNLDVKERSLYKFQWDDKKQSIEINISECFYRINNILSSFECNAIVQHDDSKYIQLTILNNILDSQVEYLPKKSELFIASETQFPKLKIDQLKRNVVTAPGGQSFNPDVILNPEYKWIDGFSYYQEFDLGHTKSAKESRNSINHYGSLDAELAKMQLKVNNAGDENEIENQWVSLNRRDYEGKLFGPLNASEFTIGNYFAPPSRHIPSSGKITGFNFHNRSLNRQSLTRFETFDGEIKPGWVVELYRNNILLERQGPTDVNRYRFEQVPLNSGLNQFLLIFYGPSGEEEREEKMIYLDSESLTTQPVTYDISLGQTDDSENFTLIKSDLPISSYYLFSLTHQQTSKLKITQTELNTNILNSSLILSGAKDDNGHVYGAEILKRISKLSLSGEYYEYNNFTAGATRNQDLKNLFSSTLSFPLFPRTQHLLNFKSEDRHNNTEETFRYRISHNLGRLYINNEYLRDKGKNIINSLLRMRINSWQTYAETSYDHTSGLESFTLGTRYRTGRDQSFSASFSHFLNNNQNYLSLSGQQVFSKVMTRLSFDSSLSGDTRVLLSLATSFFSDRPQKHYSLRSRYTREVGDLLVYTFIQKQNGSSAVENVCLNSITTREKLCSDIDGIIRFTNLPSNNPVRLQLEFSDLQNFYINSDNRNFEVYIRPGKTTRLDIPLKIYGEVEGNIYGLEKSKDNYQVLIRAKDMDFEATLKTDRDGYFYLSNVTPGIYQSNLIRNGATVQTEEFTMPEDGDLIELNFHLE